jgi:hypothetical protein
LTAAGPGASDPGNEAGRAGGPARRRKGTIMSTMYRYALPVEQTQCGLNGETETVFTWELEEDGRVADAFDVALRMKDVAAG